MDYRLSKIINIIRNLNEEMMVANSPGSSGGFSAGSDPSGPTAGIGVPMSGMISRKKTILGKGKYPGARTRWGLKRKKKKDGK